MRFRISWINDENYTGYKVSVPNYDGGEVVTIDEVKELERKLSELRETLNDHDKAWDEDRRGRERLEVEMVRNDSENEQLNDEVVRLKEERADAQKNWKSMEKETRAYRRKLCELIGRAYSSLNSISYVGGGLSLSHAYKARDILKDVLGSIAPVENDGSKQ
jgi:hypothetical protein